MIRLILEVVLAGIGALAVIAGALWFLVDRIARQAEQDGDVS